MTRLTLRQLLAYLDDALRPQDAKEIGEKIAANPAAQQLIQRINQVTRRRRLTAPEFSGEEDHLNDPNLVAAFLDGDLAGDDLSAMEKLCLESDLHLAELAACHQLMSMGNQDPITIPPLSTQRMYAIAKGPESLPNRLPPVQLTPLSQSALEIQLDGAGKRHAHRRWLIPLACCVLVMTIVALIHFATQDKPVPRWAFKQAVTVPQATIAKQEQQDTKKQPSPNEWKEMIAFATRPESLLVGIAGYAAARPTLPSNFFLALGQEEPLAPVKAVPEIDPEAKAGDIPPPVPVLPPLMEPPAKSAKETQPKPDWVKVAIGQYDPESQKEGMLFRHIEGQGWQWMKPQAFVLTHEPLLALPASRAEMQLSNKMKLTLIGSLPGAMSVNYFFETVVNVHHQKEVDLELEIERGRCLITRKPDDVTTLRLRYLDDVWLVKLLAPDTEIGVEVTGRVLPHADDGQPHRRLALYVVKGVAEVERGNSKETLTARKVLLWDNVYGGPGPGSVRDDAPAWLMRKANYPGEVREAVGLFQKRLLDKLSKSSDFSWVKVACAEAMMSRKAWEQYLALFTLGAFDQADALVATLDAGPNPYVRLAALDALLHFMGRKPGQVECVRDALKQQQFNDADMAQMLDLLRGIHAPDRDKIAALLQQMQHPRLAIRELAFRNLTTVVQPNLLSAYDPTAPTAQRDQAVEAIREKLLK